MPAIRLGSVPAAKPGAAPASRHASRPPATRPAAQPSWATVIATTFRLWAGRRIAKTRWRVVAGFAAAALCFAAGAATVILTKYAPLGSTARTSQRSTIVGGLPAGGGGALTAVEKARKWAATWVAGEVNPDEVIGCDPIMCAALQAAHIQANRLLMIGPNRPDPLGSEIILDTKTLRSQFGTRLKSVYAPVSLAAFGLGPAHISVRVVAPDGAHAYLAELAKDVAARKSAAAQILRNPSIHVARAARGQLAAGNVDTRLMEMLVTLASNHPVDIISFGTHQPGASPGVPVRSAEIAGAPGPGTPAASVRALRGFIRAQRATYHPSVIAVAKTATRRTVLRVEYPAPSLLGLLGTHGRLKEKSR